MALYASQLVLNWGWSPLFFEFHQLKWVPFLIIYNFIIVADYLNVLRQFFLLQSLIEICILWANVAGCITCFYRINKIASFIMIPYLAWLSLATTLTYSIYKNNPEIADKTIKDK